MCEKGAEGKTTVSGECPGETRDGRNDAHTADEANSDDTALHGGGRSRGPRCLVEDLDDGIARWASQGSHIVADAEEEDDDEGKGQRAIDGNSLDEHPGDNGWCILDLLAHMDSSIEA
jgi:hypothetical protein